MNKFCFLRVSSILPYGSVDSPYCQIGSGLDLRVDHVSVDNPFMGFVVIEVVSHMYISLRFKFMISM